MRVIYDQACLGGSTTDCPKGTLHFRTTRRACHCCGQILPKSKQTTRWLRAQGSRFHPLTVSLHKREVGPYIKEAAKRLRRTSGVLIVTSEPLNGDQLPFGIWHSEDSSFDDFVSEPPFPGLPQHVRTKA